MIMPEDSCSGVEPKAVPFSAWDPQSTDLAVSGQLDPIVPVARLKLQYFGQLMRRVDSLEKTLKLGGLGAGGEADDRG